MCIWVFGDVENAERRLSRIDRDPLSLSSGVESMANGMRMRGYMVRPIGVVRSEITSKEEAPRFYTEGAPNAFVEILPEFRQGLFRIGVGEEVIVLTWLHRANREVLRVHPRGDPSRPVTGVFATRSPDRPNPVGLHRARIHRVRRTGLYLGPIEAIDGTPVVDIKPVVADADDS